MGPITRYNEIKQIRCGEVRLMMQTVLERNKTRHEISNGYAVKKNGAPHGIRWSVEDYYKMYDLGLFEGRCVELIKGEIFEMSPLLPPHATSIQLVSEPLRGVFQKGFEIREQMPLDFGKYSEPEPDVAVVTGSIRDFSDHHPTNPVLVVEVSLTTLKFDQTKKLKLYAEYGIEEYWIVNLKQHQLEVYRGPRNEGDSGTYDEKIIVTEQGSVSPPGRPNSKLKIRDMLP